MSESSDRAERNGRQRDPARLMRDWLTIWQSELAALAADRELREMWQALLALSAGAAEAMLAALPYERAGRRTGADAAAGAAAVAAAPDARDAEINRLAGRLADLERRLGELERLGRAGGTGRRRRAGGHGG